MDIFDQASEIERIEREAALMRAQARFTQDGPEWVDGQPCCRECGDIIPQQRLNAIPNVSLCLSCQQDLEREMLRD